ncbi:MAG: flagellar hook-basal body complex protein [Lachnospiraceae bacterium]|nr:flagellar hook-basal body complex protein [Lachnospiraceae bacterium]
MMRALYSGVSGLKTHQTKMDVIGNNIANVNTVAFKSSSTAFSEIMYQNMSGASGATATKGGVNAKQIGLGVTTGSTSVNITTPGATQTTGDGWDLRITGNSFFIVNNGSENLFTKAGAFYVDGAGNLATKANGYNVMGWQVDPDTGDIRKDTVSVLNIMNEKNQTSPPEATTLATCSGVLDIKNKQVNSDSGYVLSLNFYDALGYNYNAKFAVKAVNVDDKNYTVELTDITDATGRSILNEYASRPEFNGDMEAAKASLFGAQNTAVVRNYKMNAAFTYNNGTITDSKGVALTYREDAQTGEKVYENADGTSYTVTDVFGITGDALAAFDGNTNITAQGTSATFTFNDTVTGCILDYNEDGLNPGTFNYIGTPGSTSIALNMASIGTEFQNITMDFSKSTCYENGDNCTLDLLKGDEQKINGTGKKLGKLTGLQVQEDGKIFGSYDNGNTTLLGQIAVANFANPSGLEKLGDNCYRTTLNSGEFDGIGQDITTDGGKMTSGVLEMSNVDLSTEFTEMITTQRGFQANSRIITTSDTLLEELVNLKR